MLLLLLLKPNKDLKLNFKHTIILLILLVGVVSCRQTKNVPQGEYLLKKNKVFVQGEKLDEYDLEEIIRQKPNFKRFGVKWNLMMFNAVDSAKVADKRARKNQKLRDKNQELRDKEDRINKHRIDRAHEKNREFYTEKIVQLKDTVTPRKFFREWLKYKIGKPPVVFDSIPYNKTIEQLGLNSLPVCMAKTQNSLSDQPALLGRPKGFTITVRDFELAAGAGFLVALTGTMMRMPALPKVPAAERIEVQDDGSITGLMS